MRRQGQELQSWECPSSVKTGEIWETSDMGTAAYVQLKGLELVGTRRDGGARGRWLFVLQDPEERAPALAIEYVNSESRKFDSAVRSLKKLKCGDRPADMQGVWETSDMGTAAYAHLRGLNLIGVRERSQQDGDSRRGRQEIVFMLKDPENQAPGFAVDYLNSESCGFDGTVKSLKKLLYDDKPTKGRRRRRR